MFRFCAFINLMLLLPLNVVQAQFEESIFDDEDIYKQGLPAIPKTGTTVPGTKWCGPGNTASNYSDLGWQRETDMCCRDHDHCEDILEPNTESHGLNNPGMFPIMHCRCEQKFLNCLQELDSMGSNTLGRVYFSVRSQCFSKGYPQIGCAQYQEGTFRHRCIRYKVNKWRFSKWQFYDIPFYSYSGSTLKKLKASNGK